MQPRADWNYPTSVEFGAGRIGELVGVVRAAGITKALLVTDPNLARLPMVADALSSLRAAGLATELFSDIRPNPVEANITTGVAAFRAHGHDGVVAFGGGSALDAGKLIACDPVADLLHRLKGRISFRMDSVPDALPERLRSLPEVKLERLDGHRFVISAAGCGHIDSSLR